ncbi:hypothetical protein HGM15179_002700 [Zosterops borbonicus]|uniref:Uncharacterized protein n=1 Tax=Zosterops borbonicus TaxID=364589 RepID=A0A8K1GUB0_9PASS|nr:hypothetical protein HGM15179_002700 [Zosterops borbonicus]
MGPGHGPGTRIRVRNTDPAGTGTPWSGRDKGPGEEHRQDPGQGQGPGLGPGQGQGQGSGAQVAGQSQTPPARYWCVVPVVVVDSWHLDITWVLSVLRLKIQTVSEFAGEGEKPEFNELPHILGRGGTMGKEELLARGGTMGKEELLASALLDFF